MPMHKEWPRDLRHYVAEACGAHALIEPLAGLSGAAVWRVAGPHLQVVVKRCAPREAQFYQAVAPSLRTQGVGVPHLLWAGGSPADPWIVLEYLPAAPVKATWLAHPGWMQTLARLHTAPTTTLAPIAQPFHPQWTEEMTTTALELIEPTQRARLREHWHALAAAVQPRFAEQHPISGDPNPRNWGMRADGSAVLFDWERVGVGAPAFDLAITISGLATAGDARQVADAYLRACRAAPPAPEEIDALAGAILHCKAAVVVEFMANVVTEGLTLDPAYAELWRAVPAWVAQIAGAAMPR
jgi:aminoglycoside phosphotransferase (APT) family kinase protein